MKSLLKILVDNGDISPLSYFFASFIAEHSAVTSDSVLAHSAALVSQNNQNGDVCVVLEDYLGRPLFTSDQVSPEDMPRGIDLKQWRQTLLESTCTGSPGDETPLILDDDRLYLNRYWHYESRVAELISSRLQPIPNNNLDILSSQLALLFSEPIGQQSLNSQALGVALAAIRRFVVISGGPGTGKTTTVVKILALLLSQHPSMRIKLAAPTGKAAARMMESIQVCKTNSHIDPAISDLIPQQASTIHRLLGYSNNRFQYSASNPLAVDCLVIDEASMLDLTLTFRLLDALPEQARVILLGDRDQLASVAAGNVLGDITGHGREVGYSSLTRKELANILVCPEQSLPQIKSPGSIYDSVALLTHSYRFAQDSDIGELASLINAGDGDSAAALLANTSTSLRLQAPAGRFIDASALDWVLDSFQAVINSKTVAQALDAFDRARILCAIHSGPFGVDQTNRLISSRIHSDRVIGPDDDYHGKPILITANSYELNLFNGDTGLLWRNEDGELRACFRGEGRDIRAMPINSLPVHTTAWAMTVHKSQGSEYDSVLLILPDGEGSSSVSRELLYTGVTRSRRNLLIQSHSKIFIAACKKLTQRSSGLAKKLGWERL